jgi:hypothetical protein
MDWDTFGRKDSELRHAIQSGLAFEMAQLGGEGLPPEWHQQNPDLSKALKHIRTGLCCIMAESAALSKLLMDKGIISADEYQSYQLNGLRGEVERLEATLSAHYGKPIRLG